MVGTIGRTSDWEWYCLKHSREFNKLTDEGLFQKKEKFERYKLETPKVVRFIEEVFDLDVRYGDWLASEILEARKNKRKWQAKSDTALENAVSRYKNYQEDRSRIGKLTDYFTKHKKINLINKRGLYARNALNYRQKSC